MMGGWSEESSTGIAHWNTCYLGPAQSSSPIHLEALPKKGPRCREYDPHRC